MKRPKALRATQVVELCPKAPFNFDATLHKPDHFPSADNDWLPGVRWQTTLWQEKPFGLRFDNLGSIDEPRVALSIWSQKTLDRDFLKGLIAEINYRYDLQLDLSEFNRRFGDDPLLGPIILKWRGMRPLNFSSLYEFLIIAIVLQNTIVRRSVSMMHALFEHYGTLLAYDGKKLYCFWRPQVLGDVAEQELRDLKVGYRAKSIRMVTAAFVQKEIEEFELRTRSRDEQRQTLLGLYGIGPASVGYLLSAVFHHHDELNYISPWEQRIYSKLFFGTEPDDPVPADRLLGLFATRFGEYRGLAVHYVWEDLFWQRKTAKLEWLEKMIRL